MDLETVLQMYFDCKKPFNKKGGLTVKGAAAYEKLRSLLYCIDLITDVDMRIDELMMDLDCIAYEN